MSVEKDAGSTCTLCGHRHPFEHSCPDAQNDAVVHLDPETLLPVGVSKPCPSTVTAHLGFKAERQLPCGLLAGHEGKHVFHIEWSDRITALRILPPGADQ